jgi:phosphopantothenoylcysteine synthetase/decarboxylase
MPVVALIICGAPLAQRVGDMVQALVDAGWETHVVGTPSSAAWVDASARTQLGIRFDFRSPMQGKRPEVVDAAIVCPATFNTTNKIVSGMADNYGVSLACETIGAGAPVVVAPMVNNKLWGHFGWQSTLNSLIDAGVRLLDVQTGGSATSPVQSGAGDAVVRNFEPTWLVKALEDCR